MERITSFRTRQWHQNFCHVEHMVTFVCCTFSNTCIPPMPKLWEQNSEKSMHIYIWKIQHVGHNYSMPFINGRLLLPVRPTNLKIVSLAGLVNPAAFRNFRLVCFLWLLQSSRTKKWPLFLKEVPFRVWISLNILRREAIHKCTDLQRCLKASIAPKWIAGR